MYEKDLTPKQPMFEQTVTAFDLNGLFQLLTNLPDFHGTIIFTPSVSLGTSCARASGEPGSLVLSQAEAKRDNGSPIIAPTQQPSSPHLVTDLATEQAMVYWTRLRDAGFVDAGWRRTKKTTLAAAAYIAENFAFKLSLPKKYTYFEEMWGIKNLRTFYREKTKFADEIDRIFRK